MNTETLQALCDSIEHWKRMVDNGVTDKDKPTGKQCALCKMFCVPGSSYCVGCPVYEHTGITLCENTPFAINVMPIWVDWDYGQDINENEMPEFQAAAQLELNFLISLLPPDAKAEREKYEQWVKPN